VEIMKGVLAVPDGFGVRNFVLGSFLHDMAQAMEVEVWHPIPDAVLPRMQEGLNGAVSWRRLESYSGNWSSAMLRKALAYAHMYWADTEAMRHTRRRKQGSSWKFRAGERVARQVGRFAASRPGLRALEALHLGAASRLPEVRRQRELLRAAKATVLFCTNQRSLEILPAVLAARSLGVPSAAFIFSWDNLSSKGRIVAPFDHYLVWSDHMRRELERFYPEIPAERIHVVGTPQFAPYVDPKLRVPREEFFARLGADPRRPLICYSGGDAGNSPEDPEHTRVLLDLVRSGQIRRRPQVVVRPTPVDDGTRYEGVRRSHAELLFAQPQWVPGRRGVALSAVPLPEDIGFLANLTLHADLNVNLASTMTLDFAIHNRPVVNIAFDVADPPIFGLPLWDYYYRFDHYRPVVELGAARFARSASDLADHVNAFLDDPQLDTESRRRLVELEVGVPLAEATSRIVRVLESIGKGGA
jgi:hypothetical protein